MTPAGWTPADAAELDVLLWALVNDWQLHRRTCPLEPCPHLQTAIAEVVDWTAARVLLSKAQALREATG